jgi:hypothetical protein
MGEPLVLPATAQAYMALWWRGEAVLPEAALLAWAAGQRVLPLLAWRAEQAGWTLPPTLAQAARKARYRTAARQALARDQLQTLSEVGQQVGAPAVLVKGAAVADVYPRPWMRPYHDIDLLLPQAATSAWVTALRERGYTAKASGNRAAHLPPLWPPQAGLPLELHTSLSYQPDMPPAFTFERWRGHLRPLAGHPGLQVPDPVAHAAYLLYHAIGAHELTLGLLPLADFKFWMDGWSEVAWEALAREVAARELLRAARLGLALTAWCWDAPWPPVVADLLPAPPSDLLAMAQGIAMGELTQRLPHVDRDMPSRDLRGLLSYVRLVLLGDPAQRRDMPWQHQVGFYITRPFRLLKNHGPTLWRLVRGDARTQGAVRAQRRLQEWIDGI